MGGSVSLLTVGTASFVGAVCFAAGYLLSARSFRTLNHDDDDDDKENQKNSSIKGARWLLYLVQDVVRGKASDKNKDAMTVVDRKSKNIKPTLFEIETLAEILEDFKMVPTEKDKNSLQVLVVRNDLKMGKGKIAAQCSYAGKIMEDVQRPYSTNSSLRWTSCLAINVHGRKAMEGDMNHATLGLYKKLHNRAPRALSRWEMCGQVKVVLRTESEEDMLVLQERAKSLKLPTHITVDAGRTQIAPNSRTVMAILGPADVVDDVTGGLKLL